MNLRVLVSISALLASACGSAPPPEPTTPTQTTTSSESTAEQAAPEAPAPEPAAAAPAAPAATTPHASKHTINGVALGAATTSDVQAALEKAGWKLDTKTAPPKKYGKNEVVNLVAYKGVKFDKSAKTAFTLTLGRQTATSDAASVADEPRFAPKMLRDVYLRSEPKLVYVFDEEPDALLVVSAIRGLDESELKSVLDVLVAKAN